MVVKTYQWITLWIVITTPVVMWDAGYCFMRPRSMPGGDLHWIWKPYSAYMGVDFIYGLKALHEGDGFPKAQSLMNLVEITLNILYVYLAHAAKWPPAPLIGFTAAVMTLWKTSLYGLQEYYCNWCNIGHNDVKTLIFYWIIPNGLWIVFPTLIIWRLGKDIMQSMHVSGEKSRQASAKRRL